MMKNEQFNIRELILDLRKSLHARLMDTVFSMANTNTVNFRNQSIRFGTYGNDQVIQCLGSVHLIKNYDSHRLRKLFEDECSFFIAESLSAAQIINIADSTFTLSKTDKDHPKHDPNHNRLYTEAKEFSEFNSSQGNDYTIAPDIILTRQHKTIESTKSEHSNLNSTVAAVPTIHDYNKTYAQPQAIISCKWTLRSDHLPYIPSEAFNLIPNRKGRRPHIVVVTGELTPSRISSLALGTGDIDCVYHFALTELRESIEETGNDEALQLLDMMIQGKRLKDIADLPLDLII